MSEVSIGHRLAHATHRGRRARNQDAVIARELSDGRVLVAVADGMGGHAAGEVASEASLGALASELEGGAGLAEAMRAANRAVFALSRARPELEGMGTTLVALVVEGECYQIANVGDSRAYRVSLGALEQITEDHSFVAEGLRAGTLTEEEAERSPWRHALTRSLGTADEVEVDFFGPFSARREPHAVLLCSDGLYKVLAAERLRERLGSEIGRGEVLERLVEEAYRAGSTDNITAALIEFSACDAAEPGGPTRPQWERAARSPRPGMADAVPVAALAAWSAPRRRRAGFSWERGTFVLCSVLLTAWVLWFLADLFGRQ